MYKFLNSHKNLVLYWTKNWRICEDWLIFFKKFLIWIEKIIKRAEKIKKF